MIDILHRYTKAVLYHSETAQTIAEAVSEAQKLKADLCGADLRGANLCGADLCGADLREADLCEADLCGADLYEANLCGANLCGANLCGANLREADLREADLYEANLCGADLCEANLREADLRGANLRGANLREADLSADYRIAYLCFGGWAITVMPLETQIGCERHPNEAWLGWAVDAPEIAAMHPNAAVWWTQHREAVCAVIRDVMAGKAEKEATP